MRLTNVSRLRVIHGAAFAAMALVPLTPAHAQQGAAFFAGKTITYVVATAPGGGYDVYGRLVAEYMQKYLPGSTVIVRNMPGAGHVLGANAVYASAPDGLTIGTFNTGLIYSQIVSLPAAKFDLTKMSWIGKAASDPRVFVVSKQSGIADFAALRTLPKNVNFATSGVGGASYVETLMLARALKLQVDLLTGYNGTEDMLAMRRGEIAGTIASRSSFEAFVANGYGHMIAQIGGKDKDLPQLSALVSEPAAKPLIALVRTQGEIARLTAGPPGIPADRLAALREAYRKAMEDRSAQAKAEKLGRPLDPAYGDDVLALVKEAVTQTPEVVALLKQAMQRPKKK